MACKEQFARAGRWAALVCAASLLWLGSPQVYAQPFQSYDPFYQEETARRAFFDNYALSAQLSYPNSGLFQNERAIDPSLLGLGFRADYQIVPQVDIGAIVSALGSSSGRRLTLSWLVLKYYRHLEHENADYAVRLAVDPRPNGRVGFPQVDAAFIYTSFLSPLVSSDFAIGLRRVQMGYREVISTDDEFDPLDVIYRRAMGWELHAMTSYNLLLDPGGSNVFMALSGDLSRYDIVELNLSESSAASVDAMIMPPIEQLPDDGEDQSASDNQLSDDVPERVERNYSAGVVWLHTGITYSRPSYQVRPYLAVPLREWQPEEFEGQRDDALLHAGVRFTLR